MRIAAMLVLLSALTTPAAAEAVRDTSFRDADGHRVQQITAIVPAPVAKVWWAFTTDAGFSSWAVPVAHITLANDGMMETSYRLDARIGDPQNIRNQIVAYVPERLLVIRNVFVPKGAPFDLAFTAKIRTVFAFEDLGDGTTRLTESGVGYGEGKGYDDMYGHFQGGNREEFMSLIAMFRSGPIDWKAQAARIEASVHRPAGNPDPDVN
jgi:uncharacterized protein YndB with AHSA1/START domain